MIAVNKTARASLRDRKLNHGTMRGNPNRSHGRKSNGLNAVHIVVDERNHGKFGGTIGDIVRGFFLPRAHKPSPKGDGMDLVRIDAAKVKRERKNNTRARNAYRAEYGQGRVF